MDLFDLWDYIAHDSVDAADRVRDEIYSACRMLSEHPLAEHVREDLTSRPVRFWLVYS